MFSVESTTTFKAVDDYMDHINQNCDNENVLKFLVGNKCDLYGKRHISYGDLINKAEKCGIKGHEMSTMPGYRGTVDDLFKDIVE